MKAKLLWGAVGVLLIAVILGAWEFYCRISGVSPALLPAPSRIWRGLVVGMTSGQLVAQTAATLTRMLTGWLLASLIGGLLGVVIGISSRAQTYLEPSLEFIRPMPASAIVPIAIAVIGLSDAMVLFVICFGAVWPVMLNAIHGVKSVEPRLKEVSKAIGLSELQYVFKIAIPNALPGIFAGMQLSIGLSLILAVVGEMIASQPGIGSAMINAARAFRAADLYAGLAVIGIIGVVSSGALRFAEKRLMSRN